MTWNIFFDSSSTDQWHRAAAYKQDAFNARQPSILRMLTSHHPSDTVLQKSLLDFEHCRQSRLHKYDRRKSQGDFQRGCKRGTCEYCERGRVGVGRDVHREVVYDGRKIVNASTRPRLGLGDAHRDMLVDWEEEEVEDELVEFHSHYPPMEVAIEDLIRPCRRRQRKAAGERIGHCHYLHRN